MEEIKKLAMLTLNSVGLDKQIKRLEIITEDNLVIAYLENNLTLNMRYDLQRKVATIC